MDLWNTISAAIAQACEELYDTWLSSNKIFTNNQNEDVDVSLIFGSLY